MTWKTGSTVFAVAPNSATARRNTPDRSVAFAPGCARGRTTRIAASLIDCALRMHSSSSGVLVDFAGAMTVPASMGRVGRNACQSGTDASSRASVPLLNFATSSSAPAAVSTSSARCRYSSGISGARPRGSRCRGSATERRVPTRRPIATTTPGRGRRPAPTCRSRTRRSVVRTAPECRLPLPTSRY